MGYWKGPEQQQAPPPARAQPPKVLSAEEIRARLQERLPKASEGFLSFYSSVVDGVVTDPSLMVIPIDDHMVHRGHAVFDTGPPIPRWEQLARRSQLPCL
jgi:hypothetical protein